MSNCACYYCTEKGKLDLSSAELHRLHRKSDALPLCHYVTLITALLRKILEGSNFFYLHMHCVLY